MRNRHRIRLSDCDTSALHVCADVRPGVAASSPSTNQIALFIEQIIVLATGRLAILLVLGWTVKYLAALHRTHSEQAVIYRDRRAALGVAELILNATPGLEQKRVSQL